MTSRCPVQTCRPLRPDRQTVVPGDRTPVSLLVLGRNDVSLAPLDDTQAPHVGERAHKAGPLDGVERRVAPHQPVQAALAAVRVEDPHNLLKHMALNLASSNHTQQHWDHHSQSRTQPRYADRTNTDATIHNTVPTRSTHQSSTATALHLTSQTEPQNANMTHKTSTVPAIRLSEPAHWPQQLLVHNKCR